MNNSWPEYLEALDKCRDAGSSINEIMGVFSLKKAHTKKILYESGVKSLERIS